MNLHLISYDENLSKTITNKYKNIEVYKFYRYFEGTHLVRNNLHIEVWRNLKNETGLVLEDYSFMNEGILLCSELIAKYLDTFCPDWEIVFLDTRSKIFWDNQKSITRPRFSNTWGGFGNYVSSFLLKRVMECSEYVSYETKTPFNASIYLINSKKVNNLISKIENLNLTDLSLENTFYRNMHLFKLYITNPRIQLTDCFVIGEKEPDYFFRFAWPKEEKNIYKIPTIEDDYGFEFEISEHIIANMSHEDLRNKLIFKLNSIVIEKPWLNIHTQEDHANNDKKIIIRFNLPDLKLKLKKNQLHYLAENQKIEISLKINDQKYSGKTVFNLKKSEKKTKKTLT